MTAIINTFACCPDLEAPNEVAADITAVLGSVIEDDFVENCATQPSHTYEAPSEPGTDTITAVFEFTNGKFCTAVTTIEVVPLP